MERLAEFTPAILLMLFIAVATMAFTKYLTKKVWANKYKSVAWHAENKTKVKWIIGVLMPYVWAPTAEELVFRVALVVIFPTMTSTAWIWIIVMSILFGAVHWFGKHVPISALIEAREKGEHKSDVVKEETLRIYNQRKTFFHSIKAIHTILPTICGAFIAYMGITHQSIWLMSGLHLAWNLLAPVVVILIFTLGLAIFVGLGMLWDTIKPAKKKPVRRVEPKPEPAAACICTTPCTSTCSCA